MKHFSRIIFIAVTALFLFSLHATDPPCGKYKDHQLYIGPKGGCYYINSSGNKTYVDRGYCSNC